MTGLRERVLHGGIYLAVREGLGLVFGLAGVVVLARLIGPRDYGLYAGAYTIVLFAGMVGRLGIDVFLVRHEEDPTIRQYHVAFTLSAMLSVGLMVLTGLATLLTRGRLLDEQFAPVIFALLPSLPLTLLAIPASARLGRDLRFRAVALIDLAGQGVYYALALPLAAFDAGVWAPVVGYLGWQAIVLIGVCWQAGYRPRLAWSATDARAMLGYGFGYSASIWIWQLRLLVNPLVVGRFAGPEGVGLVNLAIRMAEVLCFIKNATWKLSLAALARIQRDLPRLRRALEEAMTLQIFGVGPLLAGFALVAPLVVPAVIGERWGTTLEVFPYIAAGYLVNAAFNMHSAVLYVLRDNRAVTLFHAVHVALFAGASLALVPWLGVRGYGLAEVVALLSYPVIHRSIARYFSVSYRGALLWSCAFLPPLVAPLLPSPWWALTCLPGIAVLTFSTRQRRQVGEYVRIMLRWRTA